MPNTADLLDLLARGSQLASAVGLSEVELERAVGRLVASAGSLARATGQGTEATRGKLLEGVRKNLDDDPMVVAWALKLAARLGDGPWEKFFENFVIRLVVDRREIIDRLTAELGHEPPITLVVNPTMACNLRCRGCYASEFARDRSMDPALLRRILTEARELGVRFITLTGGEPFFYEGLLDFAEEFHDLTFMSYTNGTLIDDRTADRLAAVGNLFPAFSVEGYERETEARRGPGVYGEVLAAMDRLRARGVLFGVSVTPTRINCDVLTTDAFIDSCIDRGASFAWLFQYIPVGFEPELDMMCTPLQRDRLRQATVRWRKTRPIFLGDFWNDGACVGGCLSASRYCFITPDGKVQPCTFVHFYTHDLQHHTLREVFASPFFRSIRAAQPYDPNLLRSCKIIDHPHVLRRLVREHGARPSYPGAEAIVTQPSFVRHLDQYSAEYARLANKAWRGPDYRSGRRAIVPFSGLVDLYERFPARMQRAERLAEQERTRESGRCEAIRQSQ